MAFSNEYLLLVDIKRRLSSVVPSFKQGDNGVLKFEIYDNGKKYDLSDYTYSEITFRLPSGTSIVGNPTLDSKGVLTYSFTGVEMSEVGKIEAILSIYSGSTMVSIQPFFCFIYDSMKGEDLSYIGILQDLIAEVQILRTEVTETVEDATEVLAEANVIKEEVSNLNKLVTAQEQIRDSNETKRKSNEVTRVNNENTRISNENTRISKEQVRETNEAERLKSLASMNTIIDQFKAMGTYNANVMYKKFNQVEFNGNTYIALIDNAGVPVTNTDAWRLYAKKGDKGDKGDTGAALRIMGSLTNESQLPSSGQSGDAYSINGELYVWSDNTKVWENVGNVKGEKGDAGDVTQVEMGINQFKLVTDSVSQSSWRIPMTTFNPSKDTVIVIRNTTTLSPEMYDIESKLDGLYITLKIPPIKEISDNNLNIMIFKNKALIPDKTFDGSLLTNTSVSLPKLSTEIQKTLSDLDTSVKDVNTQLSQNDQKFSEIEANKASTYEVTALTNTKADKSYVDAELINKADAISTATQLNNKVDKNGNEQVTFAMLAQDVKLQMTGGSTAVVGANAVNTTNVVDKAVTYVKRTVLGNNATVNTVKRMANYDPIKGTLTIYARTFIVHGRGSYELQEDVVLMIAENGSQFKKILFNVYTNTFHAIPYNDYTSLNIEDCVLLGTINNFSDNRTINLIFDCTINGVIKEFSVPKSIPTPSLRIASRTSRIIVNATAQYPDFDIASKNLTFYNDTILVLSTGENYILPLTVVDCAVGSSAVKVYFDTTARAFRAVNYAQIGNDDWIFVCGIRTNSGVVSINCPYTVNGRLFDLDVSAPIIKNPVDANVRAIVHRGLDGAPENTIPAFSLAREKGFSYVETDIKWTSDGVPVLLHDDTINSMARNSDGSILQDPIRIADITYAQASTYDFGIAKAPQYAGTKIATFEDFVKTCYKLNLHAYLHINEIMTEQRAKSLVAILDKYNMRSKMSWITFLYPILLSYVLSADPKARVGMLSSDFSEESITSALSLKTDSNSVFINVDRIALTTERVQASIARGLPVESYTVNKTSDVELLADMGVSGITTDFLNVAELLGNKH